MESVRIHPSVESRLITAGALLSDAPIYDRVVIGVAVFKPTPAKDGDTLSPNHPSVLIVKRSAHESFLPNVWEIPGGHVEPTDPTILHAVIRETKEETGLDVEAVLGEFDQFVYKVEKPGGNTKTTIQLNFAVGVLGGVDIDKMVVLCPDEHQSHAWVSVGNIGDYTLTEGMKKVAMDALAWGQRHLIVGD
ncbi:hypothetical protein JAAARDRAFT_34742 [Jaapia argillacea MUCL 33604]|uniref:Nudix hydrolase domain-containing protein n=1 Tax=Jaapia argillacea MUCL 33604 TaxID=933084 RepID=A0A067Q5T6_9AGAM|nr:hypothetical protein JAAARDRAFT_34742 [Jaapia argillacea MUCL 33604]